MFVFRSVIAAAAVAGCALAATGAQAANLVTNGDFEASDTGFTSGYTVSPGDLTPPSVYDVISNPNADHPSFASFGDHTSGSGLMMVINGAEVPGVNVW